MKFVISSRAVRLVSCAASNVGKHEGVIDEMLNQLDEKDAMTIRRRTVEHPFGTIKAWMGATHFLMKGLKNVQTEMSLSVLAYNIKRMISIMGAKPLIAAIKAV